MSHGIPLRIDGAGVRGVAGETLTPQLVTSFAAAFGTYVGAGAVAIGTDTRGSREMMTQATIAGLLSVGCQPVLLGVVPAPALQHYVRRAQVVGGIALMASHNPIDWNAMRFLAADGISLRLNQFHELTDLYHQGIYVRVGADEICDPSTESGAIAAHHQTILERIDVAAIRARGFRVAVDCCNGAASAAAPDFLRALGCQVFALHAEPDADFPHGPEATAENTRELSALVQKERAHIGFALDADADRLGLVDEQGLPLGEECTVPLVARHFLKQHPGPVVVNLSTSQMIEAVARDLNTRVVRAPVGEISVLDAMRESGAEFGGEGSGGVIIPAINPCRDSFVAMGFVLDALASSGSSLSHERARLPELHLIKRNLPCRARHVASALRRLRQVFAKEKLDVSDGVRIVLPDGWLHVRGASTEPVIRIVAEADHEERAQALVRRVVEYVRPIIS